MTSLNPGESKATATICRATRPDVGNPWAVGQGNEVGGASHKVGPSVQIAYESTSKG